MRHIDYAKIHDTRPVTARPAASSLSAEPQQARTEIG
jgi:hypothetical protein